MVEPVPFTPRRAEAEVARELKQRLEKTLTDLCCVMNEIDAAGFQSVFRIEPGRDGRRVIVECSVVKVF